MPVGNVKLSNLAISRFILGGNPFSGNSHRDPDLNRRMRHYFTTARIKQTLRKAESLGIYTFIGRMDNHIARLLEEYWDEGGQIQWIAQTAPELTTIKRSVDNAVYYGAKAVYIHGGQMDMLVADRRMDEVVEAVQYIKQQGLPAGVAGHVPEVFAWAERNLDVDFYMCSYYNPSPRTQSAEYNPHADERFRDEDRQAMVKLIGGLSKPAIHYKIMAAGRHDPAQAIAFAARHLRPQDAVCIGIYDENHPNMLEENLRLLEDVLHKA